MGYAALSDLTTYGLPATALGQIASGVQQAALDSGSDVADTYISASLMLPLLTPYPTSLIQAVCKIAAYELMSVRGYSGAAGADENIRLRYEDAVRWLKGIANKSIHLVGAIQSPDPTGQTTQPFVSSSSVFLTGSGCSRPSRGW